MIWDITCVTEKIRWLTSSVTTTGFFDLHLKNITAAAAEGKTCELSRGIIDIPKFIKTLRKVKYSGMCSLEYEKDMKDPLAGIAESVGYYKGVVDATK